MPKTETQRTRALCEQLVKHNTTVFACVAQKMQAPGWPDRFLSHTKWRGWVEFKNPKTPLTTDQRLILRALRKADPFSAYVGRFLSDTELQFEDEEGNVLFSLHAQTVRGLARLFLGLPEEG